MPQGNGNGFTIEAIAEQIARLTEVIVAGQQADEAWREEDRRWKEGFRADLAELKAITERQGESVDRLSRVAEMLVQELRQRR
jgi:predicted GTPase